MTVHSTEAGNATMEAQEPVEDRVADIYLDAGMPSEVVRACVPQWPHFGPIADAMDRKVAERGDREAGE